MSDSNGRTNSTACPALDSDKGARAHFAGEDEAEKRQDLVVELPLEVWTEVELAMAAELSEFDRLRRSGVDLVNRRMLLQQAFETIGHLHRRALSPPDQGEHVAQLQEGKRSCIACGSSAFSLGIPSGDRWRCGSCGTEQDL